MKTKYTEKQLNEAISYWRRQLKENFNMTDEQIDAELNEGLWDKIMHPIASYKDWQQPFKDKKAITSLLNLLKELDKKDRDKCKQMELWVRIGNNEAPVAQTVILSGNKNKLFQFMGKCLCLVPAQDKNYTGIIQTVESLNRKLTDDKLKLSKLSGLCIALYDGKGLSETEIFEEEPDKTDLSKAEEPAKSDTSKAEEPAKSDTSKAEEPAKTDSSKSEKQTVTDDDRTMVISNSDGKKNKAKINPNKFIAVRSEPTKNRILIQFDLTNLQKAKGEDNGDMSAVLS